MNIESLENWNPELSKYNWYPSILALADNKAAAVEVAAKLPLYESLTFLQYQKEVAIATYNKMQHEKNNRR